MSQHESHGHSVAAWTGVTIVTLAALVMTLAVIFANTALFVVGAVLVVVGIIAGKVLAMAGYGVRSVTGQHGEAGPGRSQTTSGIR